MRPRILPVEALTSTRDSAHFEVDTTPPQIDGLKAAVEGTHIHVSFHAIDGFSNIKRAEYSVDAADWQYVEPVGQLRGFKIRRITISRWQRLRAALRGYRISARISAEHVVVVRVYDRFDNMSSAKTVIRK